MKGIEISPRQFACAHAGHHWFISRTPAINDLISRKLPPFLPAEIGQGSNQAGSPIHERAEGVEQEDFHAAA